MPLSRTSLILYQHHQCPIYTLLIMWRLLNIEEPTINRSATKKCGFNIECKWKRSKCIWCQCHHRTRQIPVVTQTSITDCFLLLLQIVHRSKTFPSYYVYENSSSFGLKMFRRKLLLNTLLPFSLAWHKVTEFRKGLYFSSKEKKWIGTSNPKQMVIFENRPPLINISLIIEWCTKNANDKKVFLSWFRFISYSYFISWKKQSIEMEKFLQCHFAFSEAFNSIEINRDSKMITERYKRDHFDK